MTALVEKLVPDSIKKLIPYQSARRIARDMDKTENTIWLNANELETCCQYGERQDGANSHYHRYPDYLPTDLAVAYREYGAATLGCQSEIMAVRGADEAIDLLVRTFCQPGNDQILVCPPTYGMYEFCADSIGITTAVVPLTESFQLNLPEITKQLPDTSIVFLCSPNNPTGNVLHQQDVVTLLEATKQQALVVVDEAYIEFAPHTSVLHLMAQYPHLVVIRTLSKAFGLAAIRVGFLIADSSVMSYVARLVAPYPIADPSAEIALKALSASGVAQMKQQTTQLIAIRDEFIHAVSQLSIVDKIYPSSTNFVLIRFKGNDNFYQYLLDHGVVARSPAHEESVQGCVRISIGSAESMDTVLRVLQNY
ncbi:histidinol-phosphate transaminase [Vibrio aphrogenes]|uniref:histidinol-phosphate transaminase n=1 Tax=Vibrio aphrogenes TaxID=1891186 RepID=UPI000B361A5C|nr:histidinol-phosphate transaminase [Vibrio aphrogenes]